MDKRKYKRLKRKAREAETRVNQLIIKRMNELRHEEPTEPTNQENQLTKDILLTFTQLTNRSKDDKQSKSK